MDRRNFLKIAGTAVAGTGLGLTNSLLASAQPDKSNNRPNILFILADDYTSQAWGIYGGVLKDYVQNHNIKRLAKEGCVLDNCFCTNSLCSPSRASILTGQYSHKNGVYRLCQPLDRRKENVAKVLRRNGYQTAIVGKWHLTAEPAGFDYFRIFPRQGRYHNPLLKSDKNWQDGPRGGVEYKGFSTDVLTRLAIKWMKNRDKNRPFMMMCDFKASHEPFDYPERYKNLYKDVTIPNVQSLFEFGPKQSGRVFPGQPLEELARRYTVDRYHMYPGMPFSTKGLNKVQAREKVYQKLVKDFMRSGAAINDNIGKLLNFLDREKLTDNTIVIFTADQGYFLGEHGFFDKRLMYEESLRMPFVIRYPGHIPAGRRNRDLTLNVDFAPLMLDYAGAKVPAEMQGRSFRKNVESKAAPDWRKSIYYRYWTNEKIRPAHFGIRNKRYKLIFFYGKVLLAKKPGRHIRLWEFYDLKKDPREMHNAYHDAQYSETIRNMKKELLQLKAKFEDTDANNPRIRQIISQYYWS